MSTYDKLDRLNAVLNSLVHSVITMDDTGRIIDVNAAVENQLGYQRHQHRFTGMTAHGHYTVPLKSQEKVIGFIFLYTDPDPA